MDWKPGGVSDDVEDRRDDSGGGGFGGGGGGFGGMGIGGPHLGIGGVILLLILSWVFHTNLFSIFSGGGSQDTSSGQPYPSNPGGSRVAERSGPVSKDAEGTEVQFVSFVLDDVQKTWQKLLPEQNNRPYRHAKLVLFRDSIASPCGQAQSATGPFYCPGDEKVYLDLGFFNELKTRFGAPGEFAQAYVIAHELGHHVQKILGTEAKVQRLRENNPSQDNPLSVRLELQADCYAGVWASTTEQRNIVHQDDIEAGLRAAAAVGDDRLQKMATGHVSPESFTHGSSAQRMQWFQAGLSSGQTSACNTFGSNQ